MRLESVTICSHSPIRLATNPWVRQDPGQQRILIDCRLAIPGVAGLFSSHVHGKHFQCDFAGSSDSGWTSGLIHCQAAVTAWQWVPASTGSWYGIHTEISRCDTESNPYLFV